MSILSYVVAVAVLILVLKIIALPFKIAIKFIINSIIGGIILAIREELGIPVRFIGLGEKFDDLEEFDLDKYLYGLCSGLIKDEW